MQKKKMVAVTRAGNYLEQLENLSLILAAQIDACEANKEDGLRLMPQLSKQYRETINEISLIKGLEEPDDEVSNILSARKADGKPDAVR